MIAKKTIFIIFFILVFGFSNCALCQENKDYNSGNHFYELYKDWTKFQKKSNINKQEIVNSMFFMGYICSYIDTCKTSIPDCEIKGGKTYNQYLYSFGKYLEDNPLERNKKIQRLLFEWEQEKFRKK